MIKGKWSESIPRKGWTETHCVDVGWPNGRCEFCGSQLRYVHEIEHPTGAHASVGVVCCENLTQDYINPRAYENELKKKAAKEIRDRKKALKLEEKRKQKEASEDLVREALLKLREKDAQLSFTNTFKLNSKGNYFSIKHQATVFNNQPGWKLVVNGIFYNLNTRDPDEALKNAFKLFTHFKSSKL